MRCRRVAELLSGELDTGLPLHQRVGLGFHTLLCGACRRYRRQLGAVEEAGEEFFASDEAGSSDTILPRSSKERLRAVINSRLDGEP
jgi:hypothetical protein